MDMHLSWEARWLVDTGSWDQQQEPVSTSKIQTEPSQARRAQAKWMSPAGVARTVTGGRAGSTVVPALLKSK